jgi:hypothetical protein
MPTGISSSEHFRGGTTHHAVAQVGCCHRNAASLASPIMGLLVRSPLTSSSTSLERRRFVGVDRVARRR